MKTHYGLLLFLVLTASCNLLCANINFAENTTTESSSVSSSTIFSRLAADTANRRSKPPRIYTETELLEIRQNILATVSHRLNQRIHISQLMRFRFIELAVNKAMDRLHVMGPLPEGLEKIILETEGEIEAAWQKEELDSFCIFS